MIKNISTLTLGPTYLFVLLCDLLAQELSLIRKIINFILDIVLFYCLLFSVNQRLCQCKAVKGLFLIYSSIKGLLFSVSFGSQVLLSRVNIHPLSRVFDFQQSVTGNIFISLCNTSTPASDSYTGEFHHIYRLTVKTTALHPTYSLSTKHSRKFQHENIAGKSDQPVYRREWLTDWLSSNLWELRNVEVDFLVGLQKSFTVYIFCLQPAGFHLLQEFF